MKVVHKGNDISIQVEKKKSSVGQKNVVDFLKDSGELKTFLSSFGVVDVFSIDHFSKKFLVSCVYLFYCQKNGKYYVGETCSKGERIGHHLNALELNKHDNPRLQKDWNDYGSNAFFVFTVFENGDCDSLDFRLKLEKSIVRIDPNFCYNQDASFYASGSKIRSKAILFSNFKKRVQEVLLQLTGKNLEVPVDILPNRITPCVYLFFCPENGFYYIGETVDKFSRLSRHLKLLKNNKHENPRLQKDWANFDSTSFFICSIMEDGSCFSKTFRKKIETEGIKANYEYCYNKEAVSKCRADADVKKAQKWFNHENSNKLSVSVPPGREEFFKEVQHNSKKLGFIFIGVVTFPSLTDSTLEFFCEKHKLFITRSWVSWRQCFKTNNTSGRPACCQAEQQKSPLMLGRHNTLSFHSRFKNLPETIGFTTEEQQLIVEKLSKHQKNYISLNSSQQKAPPKNERLKCVYEAATRLNADIVHIEGTKAKSKVVLFCRTCQRQSKGTEIRSLIQLPMLRCCTDKAKEKGRYTRN